MDPFGSTNLRIKSRKEISELDNVILQDINEINKNPNIKKVDNILEGTRPVETYCNPCYGNPLSIDLIGGFIPEKAFIQPGETTTHDNGVIFQKAGPRLHIAVDPSTIKAAIVTCGGPCPGINVVIRELVMTLYEHYQVTTIYGIKYGYSGFLNDSAWINLNPDLVETIHTLGGTVLGTSRGGFEGEKIADSVASHGINMVFSIGGDGTHRGIQELSKVFKTRNMQVILVGVPKTIDNDIPIIDRSFGLESAVQEASRCIQSGNVEANCCPNTVSLVKLFGRSSGFVALYATLASRDVNVCLIPEAPFRLYGEYGLLEFVMKRLITKKHCVIVVAEGAGFSVLDADVEETGLKDKSGNPILPDIGLILKNEIKKFAEEKKIEVNLKYIDPTYIIRTCPANSFDCNLCAKLAQNAVHCAFSGYTNFTSGIVNQHPAMIPVDYIASLGVRSIDTERDMDYMALLATTGQPSFRQLNPATTFPRKRPSLTINSIDPSILSNRCVLVDPTNITTISVPSTADPTTTENTITTSVSASSTSEPSTEINLTALPDPNK